MNERFIEAIRVSHGFVCEYVETVRIKEPPEGECYFEGDVHTFANETETVYCWELDTKDVKKIVSVRKILTVDNPLRAVQVYLINL